MDYLSDILTYIRRIIKSPSNATITDNLLIDYVNRFYINDVDARIQLFDLKTKYQFQTVPGVSDYNMPLYNVQTQPGNQNIASYPVYQGFEIPAYVNGIQVPFYTQRNPFWNLWPNYLQFLNPATIGNGGSTYTINLPYFPAIPGHLDMSGIIATGSANDPIYATSFPQLNGTNIIPFSSIYPAVFFTATDDTGNTMIVQDSGVFLSGNTGSDLYGMLITQNTASGGYAAPNPFNYQVYGTYSMTRNTVNYATGVANVTFPNNVPEGANIQAQCYFYQQGLPRAILYYNNCLTLRPPPDIAYLIEMNAYLSPAAYLASSQASQFGYMSEYIARGAARKILSDTGDIEQFQFYEPMFREQEILVWKRSQRIFTSSRTGTIFSDLQGQSNYNSIGQGST